MKTNAELFQTPRAVAPWDEAKTDATVGEEIISWFTLVEWDHGTTSPEARLLRLERSQVG